jgi:hypothetical protein
MTRKIIIAAISFALGSAVLASSASAADWIDKVDVTRAGIDVIPIEVTAGDSGYKALKPTSHKFSLHLYAKAKTGKRIVAGALGTFNGVEFFESPGNLWQQSFTGRDIGGGEAKTFSRDHSVSIPVVKLGWQGKDPVAICNAFMQQKVAGGMKKSDVLAKNWSVQAHVFFQFQAVAARTGKAKNDKWSLANTESERKSLSYPVSVTCLSSAKIKM